MASLDSRPSLMGRAALVSPGAALAPLDSDARADYLQERISLLARLFCTLGTFFLVAGCVHRYVWFGQGPLARLTPDPALLTHLGVMAFQAVVWQLTRGKRFGEQALPVVDAALALGTLSAQAYQITHLQLGRAHHVHLLILLTTIAVLMCRAVIVPSKPFTTLVVGCLGAIPAFAVAVLDGTERGVGGEAASFSAIWCAAAVALSTFTSKTIYGLRETASMAQQLGQYVIERKLGAGGMGEVYLARHTLLRRPTAVKLLPPERAGERTVRRFEREVRATSRLSHPNTVAIYDYGHTRDGVFYYAMEYLEGVDLQRLVQQQGPLPPARVVHILAQILGALTEAHAAGLVHRDLKPANVLLCERAWQRDSVKVLDFGLVKDSEGEPGRTGQTELDALVGTPAYLAPESIHSPADVDARSDLYAVGAIGYYLLTGCEVFQGASVVALCIAHLNEKPVPPSERLGQALPEELERLILSCLEKDPNERPASAEELRRALLACDVPAWEGAAVRAGDGYFGAEPQRSSIARRRPQ